MKLTVDYVKCYVNVHVRIILLPVSAGGSSKIEYVSTVIDDPQRRKPDITRAKKYLDWEPKVSWPVFLYACCLNLCEYYKICCYHYFF